MTNTPFRALIHACLIPFVCTYVPTRAFADSPPATLALLQTQTSCELLGLGAVGTVPFNFPGADAPATARFRSSLNPGIVEDALAAGANAAAPAILGGDLGSPFLHGDGKLYFVFGDSWFESPARSAGCSALDPACMPVIENNDVFASANVPLAPAGSDCIALEVARAPGTADALPFTWDGPANLGGHALGVAVPGPGFSTGRFMFALTPGAAIACEATQFDCAAANGVAGDVCKLDSTGLHRCYFGACGDDLDSPCALRLNPNRLLVHVAGTDFTEPTVGVHIASERVLEAYRGHFSVVSFYSEVDFASGTGKVWVIGRDSFWGAPGLKMSPYLMYHRVREGRIEEPMFFTGATNGEPTFSSIASEAVPLFDDHTSLPQHSSFVFVPELDRGTWIMLYGGHAQPALRNNIALFVQPVVDELFYSRDAGIYLRTAKAPWGPWSEPITVFNPFLAGQGGYCEQMYFEDPERKTGFDCSTEAMQHNKALDRAPGLGSAGEYGVAIVPGASEVADGKFTVRWLLSTWNPYRVLMQKSTLAPSAPQLAPAARGRR